MHVSKVMIGSVWVAVLAMMLAAIGCEGGADGTEPGGKAQAKSGGEPQEFEGNWVMAASVTGNKALDDQTKKNFGNYHKKYLIGREGGAYFFQAVGNAKAPKEKLQLKDGKLVAKGSIMRTEYELKDGKLVASYFYTVSNKLSHQVTFTRE